VLTPKNNRNHVSVATQTQSERRRLLDFLASFQCQGEPVSSLFPCIANGTLCSDHGHCAVADDPANQFVDGTATDSSYNTRQSQCVCDPGYTGAHCQLAVAAASFDDGPSLDTLLGIVIPSVVGGLVTAVGCVAALGRVAPPPVVEASATAHVHR
jgi:hypothetical protein